MGFDNWYIVAPIDDQLTSFLRPYIHLYTERIFRPRHRAGLRPGPRSHRPTEPSAFSVTLVDSSASSVGIDTSSLILSDLIGDNKAFNAKKHKDDVGILHSTKHAIAEFVSRFFAGSQIWAAPPPPPPVNS